MSGQTTATVLVTGAAGFIGSHAVLDLQNGGFVAVAGTRDGRNGSRRADVRDPASLAVALAGVDLVVHCAVGDRAVTVDGTVALLRAAAAAGVRRVVHLSSISAYRDHSGRVMEATPLVPPDSDGYPGWKSAAEHACLAQTGVEVVRLRPTIVYGSRSSYWVGSIARRIRSGRWPNFSAAGEGVCNLVHVSDVTGAIAAALVKPSAAGQAFNVNGPETTTWNDYFSRLAAVMGAPKLRPISPLALRVRMNAALPVKALARVRPGFASEWLLGVPGRSEIGAFSSQATYPIDAARTGLSWVPATTIEAGLVETLDWLRSEGLAR